MGKEVTHDVQMYETLLNNPNRETIQINVYQLVGMYYNRKMEPRSTMKRNKVLTQVIA